MSEAKSYVALNGHSTEKNGLNGKNGSNNHQAAGTSSSDSDSNHSQHRKSDLKHVSDIVGHFGPWQRNIYLFFFACALFSAWHGLGLAFYAPEVDHWCHRDDWAQVPKAAQLLEVRVNLTNDVKCLDVKKEHCEIWEYDDSFYGRTLVTEFDLVCDRSWLISFTKSMYMVGVLVAVGFSQVADKYGRWPVVFGGLVVEIFAGFMSAMAPTMGIYIASRFFLAMGNAARWGSGKTAPIL